MRATAPCNVGAGGRKQRGKPSHPAASQRYASPQQARQLRNIRRDPPRLITREQIGRRAPARLFGYLGCSLGLKIGHGCIL
jgi:hypothetical protein